MTADGDPGPGRCHQRLPVSRHELPSGYTRRRLSRLDSTLFSAAGPSPTRDPGPAGRSKQPAGRALWQAAPGRPAQAAPLTVLHWQYSVPVTDSDWLARIQTRDHWHAECCRCHSLGGLQNEGRTAGVRHTIGQAPDRDRDPGHRWTRRLNSHCSRRRLSRLNSTMFSASAAGSSPGRPQRATVIPGLWVAASRARRALWHAVAAREPGLELQCDDSSTGKSLS